MEALMVGAGNSAAKKTSDWPASIGDAAKRLRDGSLTVQMLVRYYLEGTKRLQPHLNAFITITEDIALATALRRDDELQSGIDLGPLHGIPIVYKDNFDTTGVRTTIGSELFKDRVPEKNATVVNTLNRAGVIMLGKTNMNEFAAGPSGTNKAFGDTHNPWGLSRSAGGTSSGTGAAIAAGLCLGGTGTDTGGSIRIPASWCGVSGIRPTFGRVSVAGVYPRAHTLDCAGPLAGSIADVASLLTVMAGPDTRDPHSLDAPTENFTEGLDGPLSGVRLGIIEDYTFQNVDVDVATAIHAAIDTLQSLGARIKKVRIPLLSGTLDYQSVFNVLLYEFSEILGAKYQATPNRETIFGPIVQSDLARATRVTNENYREAISERASQARAVRTIFSEVDALLTPTMPMTAPLLSTSFEEFDRGRQFTLPFGFLGLPALSVPCGFGKHNMPVGLQIVGDYLNEKMILRIGHRYQTTTNHHHSRPSVYWAG
jgi:aspartyl-tRNA(Asn)/glutamyl-tRNA(Gln) amidotransferase subunit A